MNMRRLIATSGVALSLSLGGVGSHAALVTIFGNNFDLTYDTTKLGLFSAPTLAGDTLFFTFNDFVAQSLNGAGAVATNSTISGLVFTAKGDYQFGAFKLGEFGDYRLNGANSLVEVTGQLRAFNTADSILTQTTDNLVVNPLTPLTINDNALHDWSASARIDSSTAVSAVPSIFGVAQNVILSKPREVGMTIENQLTAYTDPDGSGLRNAFIEKKFAGVQMQVLPPSVVPLPAPLALLAAGISVIAFLARRRQNDA